MEIVCFIILYLLFTPTPYYGMPFTDPECLDIDKELKCYKANPSCKRTISQENATTQTVVDNGTNTGATTTENYLNLSTPLITSLQNETNENDNSNDVSDTEELLYLLFLLMIPFLIIVICIVVCIMRKRASKHRYIPVSYKVVNGTNKVIDTVHNCENENHVEVEARLGNEADESKHSYDRGKGNETSLEDKSGSGKTDEDLGHKTIPIPIKDNITCNHAAKAAPDTVGKVDVETCTPMHSVCDDDKYQEGHVTMDTGAKVGNSKSETEIHNTVAAWKNVQTDTSLPSNCNEDKGKILSCCLFKGDMLFKYLSETSHDNVVAYAREKTSRNAYFDEDLRRNHQEHAAFVHSSNITDKEKEQTSSQPAYHISKDFQSKFNAFLVSLAKDIDVDLLQEMKCLAHDSTDGGKRDTEMKEYNAMQFLVYLDTKKKLFYNLIHLQWMFDTLKRHDLYEKCEKFAKKSENEVIYYTRSEYLSPGKEFLKVHVHGRRLKDLKRAQLEEFKISLAQLLDLEQREIFIDGFDEGSVIIYFILPKVHVNYLVARRSKDSNIFGKEAGTTFFVGKVLHLVPHDVTPFIPNPADEVKIVQAIHRNSSKVLIYEPFKCIAVVLNLEQDIGKAFRKGQTVQIEIKMKSLGDIPENYFENWSRYENIITTLFKRTGFSDRLCGKQIFLEIHVKGHKDDRKNQKSRRNTEEVVARYGKTITEELEPYTLLSKLRERGYLEYSKLNTEIFKELPREYKGEILLEAMQTMPDKTLTTVWNLVQDQMSSEMKDGSPDVHEEAENIRKSVLENFTKIVDEIDSTFIEDTLKYCKGIESSVIEQFSPKSGKSRKERAYDFLMFMLKNDGYVLHLKNTLKTIEI